MIKAHKDHEKRSIEMKKKLSDQSERKDREIDDLNNELKRNNDKFEEEIQKLIDQKNKDTDEIEG